MIADLFPQRSLRRRRFAISIALVLVPLLLSACAARPRVRADAQPALREFAARIPAIRAAIPALTRSAEAAAHRVLGRPGTLLNVPYWEQIAFSEEMINRAGGLALIYPSDARADEITDHDVVLLSVRSWAKDGKVIAE